MPIYEYECEICGSRFERMERTFGGSDAECPQGHRPVRRLFAPPRIIFRGPGFYSTDHGGKSTEASSEEQERKSGD